MEQRKFPRPGYVTFISITLLIGAAMLLVAACATVIYPPKYDAAVKAVQSPATAWAAMAASLMMMVSAIAMFFGANWGRMLYYFGCVPVFLIIDAIGVMQNPLTIPVLVVRLIVLGIYCAVLASERSNRFFAGRKTLFKEGSIRDYKGYEGTDFHKRDYDY